MGTGWPPKVGEVRRLKGDVTTLNAIGGPRPRDQVERMLGYRVGRLNGGYLVALLVEPLTAADFDFGGTTLRSGGREGLPAATRAADLQRRHVSERVQADRGATGYDAMRARAAKDVLATGWRRIAKVLPFDPIDDDFSPAIEFPMGGGGLQWTIRPGRERAFLMALHVSADMIATTPFFSVSLDPSTPFGELYANRARITRYLETALP